MNNMNLLLENDEKAIFKLRSLYKSYGYSKYKMSKFEEYDFYVRNKDFLVSDNIITFTDTDGRLMALKPDVTLSIIKNSKDREGLVQKVYYNENVYRASSDTHEIKEIMHVGLECIGDLDDYCVSEVVLLAAKSLECISDDFVLDISHMGIISQVLDSLNITDSARKKIIRAMSEKNIQAAMEACAEEGVSAEDSAKVKTLVATYGSPDKVLPVIKNLVDTTEYKDAIAQLEIIWSILCSNGYENSARIDFSVANNMKYYSGVAFRGFINGIPEGVLSGGQYNKLMEKLKRKSGAIGFAVYTDMIKWLEDDKDRFDADIILLYSDADSISDISKAVSELSADGEVVMAQKTIPEKIHYKKLMKLEKGKVTEVENNA